MIKREACFGCSDDFYNGRNNIGVKQCWHRTDGQMVRKIKIPSQKSPPYSRTSKLYPNCYHADGYVFVSPDALTDRGYWR